MLGTHLHGKCGGLDGERVPHQCHCFGNTTGINILGKQTLYVKSYGLKRTARGESSPELKMEGKV